MENKKHKGGAPKKSDAQRRDHRITVRYTKGELEQIERQAKRLNLKPTEVIRQGSLNVKIQHPVSVEHIDAAIALSKMANNINQCAKRLAEIQLNLKRLMRVYEESGKRPVLDKETIDFIEQMAQTATEQTESLRPEIEELRAMMRNEYTSK